MRTIDKLNKSKHEALTIIREMIVFMQDLYPLNNVRFMNEDEKKQYDDYLNKIKIVNHEYEELYNKLSPSEKKFHEHINIMNKYMETIYQLPSLNTTLINNDFKKNRENALCIIRTFIRRKIAAEKNNNLETVKKCDRVIDSCEEVYCEQLKDINYRDYVRSYEDRLRRGRTNDDEKRDYQELVKEAENLAIEYAIAKINGISEEETIIYLNKFDDLIIKGKNLLRFLSQYDLDNIQGENIEFIKAQVDDNPKKYLTNKGIFIVTK